MREMGKKGQKVRWSRMTKKQRSEYMSKLAKRKRKKAGDKNIAKS